ncbi:Ribosome biogenesis protein brx1 [Elasticomyces elasticus]|nr:Ribosome biogenesis protein brx1 [Elasticomyces elasticus]
MASIYKRAAQAEEAGESDMSDISDEELSSGTIEGDSSASEAEVEATTTYGAARSLVDIPVELRNRILMLTSRGVSFRHRHLLTDLHALLPHAYKDTKLDTKSSNNYNSALNALADLHSCNYVFFLEGRKQGQDLYLWLARAPNGPTIKFNVTNVHTMAELGFGGNCLKGGRGIVVFDKSFDENISTGAENRGLIREMLRGVFCVPGKGVRGMKPFVDRVIGIYGLDDKIWIRTYEIREGEKEAAQKGVNGVDASSNVKLVEIGPRLVLTPIVILEGSFGGPVIFENKLYVSPNLVRREIRLKKGTKYAQRTVDKEDRTRRIKSLGLNSGSKRARSGIDNATLFG